MGEVFGRLKVVIEIFWCWLFSMDVVKGVGKFVIEGCEMELFWKRLVRVLEVIDLCFCCCVILLLELLEDELFEDMMKEGGFKS